MNNFKTILETFNVKKPGTIHFGKPKISKKYGLNVEFNIKIDIEGENSTYHTVDFDTDGYHDSIGMTTGTKFGGTMIDNVSFDSIIFDKSSSKKEYHIIAKKKNKEIVVIGMDNADEYYPSIILKGIPGAIEKAINSYHD